ncbi:MAG: hypothetical protein IJ777_03790 [Clostridia bacterium]|nr:hypothetical protein [Clostridia bacterium]
MTRKFLNEDFNSLVTIGKGHVIFNDLEEMEPRDYRVSVETVKKLVAMADISLEEASYLLGKVEQIRSSCNGDNIKLRKINEDCLVNTFATILMGEEVNSLFERLTQTKYHQIIELCEAENPIDWYREEW